MASNAKQHFLGYFFGVLICCGSIPAFAIDKIYSPYVEQGEVSVEYSGNNTFDRNRDKNGIQEHQFSLEYGATNNWETELYANYYKDPENSIKMSSVEWENRFQLAEQGQYWVDPGLLFSYARSIDRNTPDNLEAKLLLAKDTGRFTHVVNAGFEQAIGKNASDGPDWVLLWSTRYRYNEYAQPGFEIQSDFGQGKNFNSFGRQEHYVGPALYGMIVPHLKYEAAYLFGISNEASQSAARMQLEYEMNF